MFDIRRIQVHSLKDFFREYLMIVLGILTALGLEHLVADQHHRHEAEQARQRIVAELRSNLAEVRAAVDENERRIKPVDDLVVALRNDVQAGTPRAAVNRTVLASLKGMGNLGYAWPTLRHEAWDVVVANQAAAYLDSDVLQRYAAAYAAQRDAVAMVQAAEALMSAPRVVDAIADLRLQRAEPIELMKALGQVAVSLAATQSAIRSVQGSLEASLAPEPAAGAAPSSR